MRLFIGVELPSPIAAKLARLSGGIPSARWEPEDKLHVTLRFLGELDHGVARRVETALDAVACPPFAMALRGVGVFPLRGAPKVLWAGLADPSGVTQLRHAIDRALEPLRLEPDRRKYHPHVTLARLKHPPARRVAEFVAEHGLLSTDPFEVDRFQLYSSVLAPRGSKFRIEAEFELLGPG